MGGTGSGCKPGRSSNHRGGQAKRLQGDVTGNGVPLKPAKMPEDVDVWWDHIAAQAFDVAYEQDSDAITSMAYMSARLDKVRAALQVTPLDELASRMEMQLEQKLFTLRSQFGLMPKPRQQMLPAKVEEEEVDELDAVRTGKA